MKQVILIVSLWLLCLLSTPGTALASCSSSTVITPDGSILYCTTCCNEIGQCQTTCR